MKSNPYVYPYTPFNDLSNKNIRNNFTDKKIISLEDLKELMSKIETPEINVAGETTAQKIFSVFKDENVRFGPLEYINNHESYWLEKLSHFIDQSLPIQFTLLGFPFKIPVPLKTDRIFPDMGEVLALFKLYTLAKEIKSIYKPGIIITIFTEGGFGNFLKVPEKEWISYREFLKELNEILGFDLFLKIQDLSDMEKSIPDFDERYRKRVEYFKSLYEKKDPEFMKKYEGVYGSVYRIVSTLNYDQEILFDVYNDKLSDKEVGEEISKIREDIKKRTHSAIFNYVAYLKVRDDIDYLEKTIPNGLALSVSPKPKRLGVIPVNKDCTKLPYHGVVVYYPEKDSYLIEYLIDIKRSNFNYTSVYFGKDKEDKPFYYIIQKHG